MPALLDIYSSYGTPVMTQDNFQTVNEIRIEQKPETGIRYRYNSSDREQLNNRHLLAIERISKLEENWDEDDAMRPDPEALDQAKFIILLMNRVGQGVYHVAPGPRGEIMLDLRNGGKSVELLFFAEKSRYVKFGDANGPEQGIYSHESLPELLTWLNS